MKNRQEVIMNPITKEVYSEVYSILNLYGNEYINKLPSNLYKLIQEERKKDYNPVYVDSLRLNEQNIKKESISMIALFHLKYWSESEEERAELKRIFKENQEKHDNEIRNKYNPDDIFHKKTDFNTNINEEVSLVEYKIPIWKKLINKIKNLFKIK